MKRTEYFESVAAVNQYYPDGVPSTVIAIVGDGSNVFVSSDNAASGNQQYYSADMTNDEIVAEQVQAAEQQGYDTGYDEGYAAGQTAGGANWLDILFLDEKVKAETALNVSTWTESALKYNFAIEVSDWNGGCVNPMGAVALIQGVLQDATIAKVIKITKDANDNAIITYHNCYTNFDGTNLGAISLDGVTYYNKMCLWSDPITLTVGDEVIMDVAASVSGGSMMLFGGYDKDAKTEEEGIITWLPATYKCTTAGTYTFGIYVDVPQAQNPQAIAFVSTMFNYEGSATVPAIGVPTGDIMVGYYTGEKLENTAASIFATSEWFTNSNARFAGQTYAFLVKKTTITDMNEAGSNIRSDFSQMLNYTQWSNMPLGIFVEKYSNGVFEIVDNTNKYEISQDGSTLTYSLTLAAGDKVGFSWALVMNNDETGYKTLIYPMSETNYGYMMVYDTGEVNEYDEPIITHFYTADTAGNYTMTMTCDTSNNTFTMSFAKVTA